MNLKLHQYLKRIRFALLYLILFLIYSAQLADAKILMSPYLQALTQNSVYVLVESDKRKDITVFYQEENNYTENFCTTTLIAETSESTYIHKIKLSPLKINTKYKYWLFDKKGEKYSGEFTTLPQAGSTFRFAIMGDCRSNPEIFAKVVEKMKEAKPLFSIYLGDLCYSSRYDKWKETFFIKPHLEFISSVPFYNAVGNHEGWKQNTRAFLQVPESASNSQEYYSVDIADMALLILNNEIDISEYSKQFRFAKKYFSESKAKWKISASHKPAYSAGGHAENKEMILLSKEVFEPYGVNANFSAHNHFFQHNRVNNVNHIITAGAGAPLYTPKDAEYIVKTIKTHHYTIVDISPDYFKLRIYDLDGNLIYSYDF
ncbi:MAG TPA: metallophosphoesterase [Candidatus Kapabacteria bacterium]|nr:metallophosphoesterase [Candidatus Kapabacteria bacterium]HPO64112.1 metallophosphoesterase [Candidatus Kapabacteria bacterium]